MCSGRFIGSQSLLNSTQALLSPSNAKNAHVGWTSPTGDFRLPELGEQVSLHFLGGSGANAPNSKMKKKRKLVFN